MYAEKRKWIQGLKRDVIRWKGALLLLPRNEKERDIYGDFYLANIRDKSKILDIGVNPYALEEEIFKIKGFENYYYKVLKAKLKKATGLKFLKAKTRGDIVEYGRYYLVNEYGFALERQIDFDRVYNEFFTEDGKERIMPGGEIHPDGSSTQG